MQPTAREIYISTALSLFCFSVQAASEYKLTILPCPGGEMNFCLPSAISKDGIAVGLIFNGSLTALKWENGKAKILRTPRGLPGVAHGVNDSAQVVGSRQDGFELNTAVAWSSEGAWESLASGQKYSVARDINNAGQVVGWAYDAPESRYSAILWDGNVATRLPPVQKGNSAIARVINERGWIGGHEFGNDGLRGRAVIWKNGVPMPLGTLGGDWSEIRGLNSNGIAVGLSLNSASNLPQPFLWKNGTMTELPTGTVGSGEAKAINDSGFVVGALGEPSAPIDKHLAVVWRDGVLTDLNSKISAKDRSKYSLVDAVGIDSRGNILGWVYDKTSERDRAFLLSPKY